MADLTEVRRLLAHAKRCSAEGRALIDQSLAARSAALTAIPAGVTVQHQHTPAPM